MSLFQYFPNNYIWNLSVDIAIESGAKIGEIEDMCRPLLEAAATGADAGTGRFLLEWVKMADKLVGLAAEDELLGRRQASARGALLHHRRKDAGSRPSRPAGNLRQRPGQFPPRHEVGVREL
jgi:hypothetical protein